MTEPARPRLTLVDEALKAVEHDPKNDHIIRDVLTRFGPAYVKRRLEEERDRLLKRAGVQALDDLSMLTKLTSELDARWQREEAKHGHAMYWRGAMHWSVVNLIVGAALACIAIFTMQAVIWDTATRAFREQAMTGAILSTQQERVPQYGRGE